MEQLILELMQKFPWFGTFIMIVGFFRLILKPLFSFLHSLVNATDWTESDNEWLKKVEESKVLKALIYFLDWFGSIKIKK